jgi:hypothetical protein
MIALQGVYDNGNLSIKGYVPAKKANVLVIFPDEKPVKTVTSEDLALFEALSGSISADINERAELLEALDERYARID